MINSKKITINCYFRSKYFKPETNLNSTHNLNYIQQYKTKLSVFQNIIKKYRTSYKKEIDDAFFFGFCISIGISLQNFNELTLCNDNETEYNYYKDSNIPEIQSCLDILHRIQIRVKCQLKDWPDHAVLIDIMRITEKIYSLPSTSPIVRFNAGFQILRQKIDEWNRVAHKNNNLKDLEIEVAEFVQKCTKMELQHWRECLTQTFLAVQEKSYKYWFFIYNLIHEYLTGSTNRAFNYDNFEINEETIDNENTNHLKSNEILSILKQFIEKSNYGDFSLRMKMIKSFELYLNLMLNTKESQKIHTLIAILHNLYEFFEQFAPTIEAAVKQIRTPIEKKLKEFVKIESYNKDLSYFGMKNNIAHVHRNLHKFLKEYEGLLIASIAPVFLYKSKLDEEITLEHDDKGKNLRYETKVKYYMIEVRNFMVSPTLKVSRKDCFL